MDNQEAHVAVGRRNRTGTQTTITQNTEYQKDEQHCSQQKQSRWTHVYNRPIVMNAYMIHTVL
jgi:hypothetical protein